MRKIILMMIFIFSVTATLIAQENKDNRKKEDKQKNWSLSLSSGYINIPSPNLGNNIWGSANIGYSKNKWSFVLWAGSNYWIEGKQPDLRLGITTTYTILKW